MYRRTYVEVNIDNLKSLKIEEKGDIFILLWTWNNPCY